jgi:hypothetical protein
MDRALPCIVICGFTACFFVFLGNDLCRNPLQAGDPGGTTVCNPMCRAGNPHCISFLARPSNEPADCGYYIGGGAATRRHSDERCLNEGTWGWDYAPWYSRVTLKWYHGRCYQGGEGQYHPDRCNVPLVNCTRS